MFVDGVLIPVRYLCTGATIAQGKVREVTYYHVELPRHDVMRLQCGGGWRGAWIACAAPPERRGLGPRLRGGDV